MKLISRYFNINLSRKKQIIGFLFVLPFIIGFTFFFLYPFIQTIIFSFSKLIISKTGFELKYTGFENYKYAFLINPDFNRVLIDSLVRLLSDIPLIISFSFFASVILNQKFKGRVLARIIFFFPVIYGAGIILQMESSDYMMNILQQGQSLAGMETEIFSADFLEGFFVNLKLPEQLLNYIISAQNHFAEIVKASGVQILIFLAGLQSIPSSLYEAAKVEGATAWENFWKITFPLISPLIVTNIVYTIIHFYVLPRNQIQQLIRDVTFESAKGFGRSAAMANIYFSVVMVMLAVIIGFISRKVVYFD